MQTIPQIKPVSTLQRNYKGIIDMLPDGPVFLSQGQATAAVMVGPDEWNRIANRLSRLERIIAGDKAIAANDWVSSDEVDAEFKRMGIG